MSKCLLLYFLSYAIYYLFLLFLFFLFFTSFIFSSEHFLIFSFFKYFSCYSFQLSIIWLLFYFLKDYLSRTLWKHIRFSVDLLNFATAMTKSLETTEMFIHKKMLRILRTKPQKKGQVFEKISNQMTTIFIIGKKANKRRAHHEEKALGKFNPYSH